jgi:hypothetical protein
MSERIPAPTDIANTNWNTDGTTYPSVDPGASKRATGWKPINVPPASGDGEIITANDQNYMHKLWGLMITWVKQFIPREWTELSEGITNASVLRQLFRVTPPNATTTGRLGEIFSTAGTATGAGNVAQVCTDGQRVYYANGTLGEYLVGASPVDLTEEWEYHAGAGNTIFAATTDGRFVYYVSDASSVGLWTVGLDGTGPLNGGTTHSHSAIRANGGHCAGINGSTGAGDADIWVSSPISLVATKATGSAGLNGIAVDESNVYVGGARNGGVDIWAYLLATGAAAWTAALDANAPTVRAICTDGDFIYVCTDDFAIAAGGNRCLFCLDKTTGAVLWSFDLGVDLLDCAVDADYLYVIDSGNVLYMFRLRAASVGVVQQKTNVSSLVQSLAVDGVNVFCRQADATTNIRRLSTGGATKTFMRASGQDVRRRPTFTLGVPLEK